MVILLTITFLLTLLAVGLVWALALRWRLLDHPNARSFHQRPTPRMGGIGVLLGVGAGLLAVGDIPRLWPLLGVAVAIALVSLLDDLRELPRLLRFGTHGAGAAVLMGLYTGWGGGGFPLIGDPGFWVSVLLVFIWITGLINAYNFMDGTDGIAGWQGLVAAGGWALLLERAGQPQGALFFGALGAAALGFLCWNRPRASIFLGDAGSTFFGLLFAAAPLVAIAGGMPGDQAFGAAVLFVWPFIADTAQTLAWRAVRREPIFEAHRSHIYQRLAATFRGRERGHWVVGLLYGGLALLGLGLHFREGPFWGKLGVLAGVWVAVAGWTWLRETEHAEAPAGNRAGNRAGDLDETPPAPDKLMPSVEPPAHQPFRIPLCPPVVPERMDSLADLLKSGNVGPYGPELEAFEAALSEWHDGAGVILTSSGTAALHMALLAAGLGPGDRVICPTYTFAATLNAVRYCGAEPVLVDATRKDWGLDPEQLRMAIEAEKAAGHALRGVLAVHAYGIPMDVEPVAELCRTADLFLIEDTAGALGSRLPDGQPVGLSGLAGAGSFNANKLLTTGMGGMLVSRDREFLARARLYANQGKAEALHYEHTVVGMNYRMSNFNAALGLAQWPELEERIQTKRAHFTRYAEALKPLGFEPMPQPPGARHNHWMHAFLVPRGAESLPLIQALRDKGLEAAPLWKPMHRQLPYQSCPLHGGEVADDLFLRGLVLPSGLALSDAQFEAVVENLRPNLYF